MVKEGGIPFLRKPHPEKTIKINEIIRNSRHAAVHFLNSGTMQLTLSTISLALTTAVVVNAWYQKQQFYPAVVYVTKSNASMAVIDKLQIFQRNPYVIVIRILHTGDSKCLISLIIIIVPLFVGDLYTILFHCFYVWETPT